MKITEVLLWLDGTMSTMSYQDVISHQKYNEELDVYYFELDNNLFEFHNNMWMQIVTE